MDSLKRYFLNPSFIPLGVQLSISELGIIESKKYQDNLLHGFLTDSTNVQYLGLMLLKEQYPDNYEDVFLERVQDDICTFCEIEILGCSSSSSTSLCEGCCCEVAQTQYLEELDTQFEIPTP
jgi:hypothetical protein